MGVTTLHTDFEQHYLQHEFDKGLNLIEEPKGWRESNKKISRSKKNGEIISKNAKDVVFIGRGREYILSAESVYGSNTEIYYSIKRRNPKNAKDVFFDTYSIDLLSMKDKNGELSVKVDEGGLSKKLQSKQSVKLELDRETSLEGDEINSLETKKLYLEGRRIFLRSILNNENAEYKIHDGSKHGGYYYVQTAIPVKVSGDKSHEEITDTFADEYNQRKSSSPNKGSVSLCFFLNSDRDKTVSIDLDINLLLKRTNYRGNERSGIVKINLVVYQNNTEFDLKERIELFNLENPHSVSSKEVSYNGIKTIDLKKDESLSLEILTGARMGNGFPSYGWGRWNWDIEKSSTIINISEESEVEGSQTKVIQGLEFMDRHLEIITGKRGLVYSEALGRKDLGYNNNGIASSLAVANGWWVRKFESSFDRKISSSFTDSAKSINAMFGLDYMIEKVGNEERVRFESLEFFYSPNITITLPNVVKDLEITKAKEFMYSSYEFGYEKGGSNYEEATGIKEYNGKIEYFNELATEKKLSKLSKIRGDSSGYEFARRQSKSTHPEKDTRYDDDLFAFTTKNGNTDVLLERKWEDDFDEAPTGIYDPDSATNLIITPARMMKRRPFWIAGALHQYQNSYIRYASANCNSNLQTKKDGKYLKENGDIKVSDYGSSLLTMYWAKFTHKVDFELSKKLREKTIIDNEEVYNFLGLVEFRVSANTYRHGWLFEVKENGKGEFKVLLAKI